MRLIQRCMSIQGTLFGVQSIVFSRLDMSSWTLFVKQITASNTVLLYRTVPFSYLRYERMYIFIRIYICKESTMNLRKVPYRGTSCRYGMVPYQRIDTGTVACSGALYRSTGKLRYRYGTGTEYGN